MSAAAALSGNHTPPLASLADSPRREAVLSPAKTALAHCLSETHFDLAVPGLKSKSRGKVMGIYDSGEYLVLATTDRQGAIDRVLASIPFKRQLEKNIITPTTKAADHDVRVTPDEIIVQGLMTCAEYEEASSKALSLFKYGQCVSLDHGLLLVDTKYEFGKESNGTIYLIDEVHTPDSSRYWISHSYEERLSIGLEPENVDKEFLRLWFKDHCNPYVEKVLPAAPEELICELAWRYAVHLLKSLLKRSPSTTRFVGM